MHHAEKDWTNMLAAQSIASEYMVRLAFKNAVEDIVELHAEINKLKSVNRGFGPITIGKLTPERILNGETLTVGKIEVDTHSRTLQRSQLYNTLIDCFVYETTDKSHGIMDLLNYIDSK